ncbi:hypothetical protein CYMTET_12779, partial [Cymbomonas tetramitiformis]
MVTLSDIVASEGVVIEPDVQENLQKEQERLKTSTVAIPFFDAKWPKNRMKGGGGVKTLTISDSRAGNVNSRGAGKRTTQLGFKAPGNPPDASYAAGKYGGTSDTNGASSAAVGVLRARPPNQLAFSSTTPATPSARSDVLQQFHPHHYPVKVSDSPKALCLSGAGDDNVSGRDN